METARAMMRDPGKRSLCIEALKKASNLLIGWNPEETEQDWILHAELWAKLGR